MKNLIFVTLLAALSFSAAACDLSWTYIDDPWIDGYRIYQEDAVTGDAVEVGEADADLRTLECTAAGVAPSPGAVTMTTYRGPSESAHSAPATIDLTAPGEVHIQLAIP